MEILPEYLYEFDSYKEAAYDYLSEEDYNFYSSLLRDIDKVMEQLLVIPAEISMVYCYTSIPGEGKESINLVKKAIRILEKNNIEPPDPQQVEFSSFDQKNGWGEPFEGTKLSRIL